MTTTEQEPGGVNGVRLNEFDSPAPKPLIPKADTGLEALCARVHGAIECFLARDAETDLLRGVQGKTREAVEVISTALETYSIAQLSLSYNGGKDCLVLLVLYLHGLYRHYLRFNDVSSASKAPRLEADQYFCPIQSVYIRTPHPFPEVETFVQECERAYSLTLERYTTPMKAAFAAYLADHPRVEAIFVGTRRTDPHGASLTHFDMTDHGWPKFMRIHPVIDWHYVEIWSFIKELGVPYCMLYDMGYTSLGGTNDTMPNPALRLPGSTSQDPKFRPAHELILDEEERLGRERALMSGAQTSVAEGEHIGTS